MQSKNLLYILIAAILFVNFYGDLAKSNEKNIKKLNLIENKIEKEEWVSSHIKDIKKTLKDYKEILKKNQNLFIEGDIDAIAMNTFQESLKKVIALSKAKELVIKWGEPYKIEEGYFTALPMRVVIDCKPENVSKFFKNLSLERYLISIDSLEVAIMDNKIRFFLNLLAFKLNKKSKNG